MVALDVLAEGEGWLAINKPPGLLSVPGRLPEKADSVLTRVRVVWPAAEAPHRLDMATSGVVIVSKSKEPHRALCRVFRERRVEKRYVAIVHGRLEPTKGTIELPIGAVWEDRPRRCVDHESGKPAETRYEVTSHDSDRARVELEPITGRTHQLRVHLAALGHPILGDQLYATGEALEASPRLLLHARFLSFEDPDSDRRVEIACPPAF